MTQPTWNIQADIARLNSLPLCGQVEMARPDSGVHGLEIAGQPLAARLFRLSPDREYRSTAPAPVSDQFVRQEDLFVQYTQTEEVPFATSVYWRLASPGAIALVASVQTDLLDVHPELFSRTECPAADARRLLSANDQSKGRTWTSLDNGPSELPPEADPYCILLRLPGGAYSYAEMIHPADFRGATIRVEGNPDSRRATLSTPLITRWMEKGVILRARAQGLFLPRADDERAACAAYHAFLNAQLPLTA